MMNDILLILSSVGEQWWFKGLGIKWVYFGDKIANCWELSVRTSFALGSHHKWERIEERKENFVMNIHLSSPPGIW